jgi:hypothetical protein
VVRFAKNKDAMALQFVEVRHEDDPNTWSTISKSISFKLWQNRRHNQSTRISEASASVKQIGLPFHFERSHPVAFDIAPANEVLISRVSR